METALLNSKMNEYMFRLNQKMGGWLSQKLPKITDDWWEELVINNLSMIQKEMVLREGIQETNGLDLAALLRVVDRNWFVITSIYYLNNWEREKIHEMQQIRNDWAHITPSDISKEKVIHDANVIIALMQTFGASMLETQDMEAFVMDVEEDKDICSAISEPIGERREQGERAVVPIKSALEPTDISVGGVVTLVSDPETVGAVIGIHGNSYSVLINGTVQDFYREQIQLQEKKKTEEYLPLKDLRIALTAYQINNPSSRNLYSLNAARIDFVPYQFRPALKMIQADSPRILVADDVGVGKTIEAGLILKEMEARSSLNSVLVICPRPLVAERKWQLEMRRFDENFTQLDGKALAECIQETDRDGVWPERHSKTVIPYSLFNESSILGTQAKSNKRRKNLGIAELDPMPHFDLVIVDEAHNIRNSNTWMYRGVELFCRNADAVVFLTATPLQNSNNDLYTLLNLLRPDVVLDKDTFKTMAEPNTFVNSLLCVVRKQEDGWQAAGKREISNILGTTWGRNVIQHSPNFEKIFNFLQKQEVSRDEKIEAISMIEGFHSFHTMINRTRRKDIEDFCIRRTQTVNVPFNNAQRVLYDALVAFESAALAQLHGSKSVRFMLCTIMRQASSCIYGLAPFLQDLVHKRMAQIQEDGELYENEVELSKEDENTLFRLAEQISEYARSLPAEDPKLTKLLEIVDQKQKDENNRMIIFSSFRHTLAYLKKNLQLHGVRVGQVDGSVPDEERYRFRQRFLLDRGDQDAIDVLLFSEVACEGLDYQFCDSMVNYDLPWNPKLVLAVTFDSGYAKDHRDVAFLTQMHPLVMEAAEYESKKFPCNVSVCVADSSIPSGDYEFLIYAWKYVGLRGDIHLIAVSDNEQVEKNILSFLRFASESTGEEGTRTARWDNMDQLHYARWQAAKEAYVADVRKECEYRLEQITYSGNLQSAVVRAQIDAATDEKIKRMRVSQLENLKKKCDEQKRRVEDTIGKADIHANLLVRGVLHID